MKFNSIEMQNFLSFGPLVTLDLCDRGLVAVFGSVARQRDKGRAKIDPGLVDRYRCSEGAYFSAPIFEVDSIDLVHRSVIEMSRESASKPPLDGCRDLVDDVTVSAGSFQVQRKRRDQRDQIA